MDPKIRSRDGFAQIILIVALTAIGGAALVPNWRPWNWAIFQKAAPTAALTAAQHDLQKARADAAAKELAYQTALSAQKAQLEHQLRYAQETGAGIKPALIKAPQTAEVVLAEGLADRMDAGLAAAIGDLPEDRRREIMQIVDQALSAKQQEVDQAKAQLAARDKDLQQATDQRKAVEAQLPVLKAAVDTSEAKAQLAQANVTAKTAEVVTYADKVAQKEKESGSLSSQLHSLLRIGALIGLIIIFCNFILPSLAQEFPAVKALTVANQISKSVTSAHL